MKVAHIILAHKNPAQVARLVDRLHHPQVDCWVHVDKKADINSFRTECRGTNVSFVRCSKKVVWGSFSSVQAMLSSMEEVAHASEAYTYFNFLSGQDYPIKPASSFFNILQENPGRLVMNNRPFDESQQNIVRFRKYHFNEYGLPASHILHRAVNKILPSRKFPFPQVIRKGSPWMTLSREGVMYILGFLQKNPRYGNYFKRVHGPDEFFFQTLLYNSPLRHRIVNPNLHYIDWSEKGRHPKVLTMADLDVLRSSDRFFARKFDANVDAAILDAIDQHLLSAL